MAFDRVSAKGRVLGAALITALLVGAAGVRAEAGGLALATAAVPLLPRATLSLGDFARSAANLAQLQARGRERPVEEPAHLLPHAGSTAAPAAAAIGTLPHLGRLKPRPVVRRRRRHGRIGGFDGLWDGAEAKVQGGVEYEPPDQGMAVAKGVVFLVNNVTLQLFTTSGAAIGGPVSLYALFDLNPSLYLVSDPHVLYDAHSRRWFLDMMIYGQGFSGFGIAVSQTSDANGVYNLYEASAFSNDLSGCGGSDCLADFPQAGYDANGYFIASDLFNASTEQFVGLGLYVFAKKELEAGDSTTYVRFTGNDFAVQPAVPAGRQPFVSADNGTEYLMEARNIVDGSSTIRVIAVTNTAAIISAPGTLGSLVADLPGIAYGATLPEREPDVVGPYCQSQGVTSPPQLDGGYDAFTANIVFAGEDLFGVLPSGAKVGKGQSGNVLAYFVVKPKPRANALRAKMITAGYIVPPLGYSVTNPSIALKNPGQGVIGMSIVGANSGTFPGAAVIEFHNLNPRGGILLSARGSTTDDGFTGCSGPGPGGVGRWGDYGAATIDPNSAFLYTANETIPDGRLYPRGQYANWGSFVTVVR